MVRASTLLILTTQKKLPQWIYPLTRIFLNKLLDKQGLLFEPIV
jgi:hypothetical protein